jgi:hypothetical protein
MTVAVDFSPRLTPQESRVAERRLSGWPAVRLQASLRDAARSAGLSVY